MMFPVSDPNIRLFAVQNKIKNTTLVYPARRAESLSHSARRSGAPSKAKSSERQSHGRVIPRRYPMDCQRFVWSRNGRTEDSGMTVRSAALTIVAAAGFIPGHGPVSAAAPKHVVLIMMENHGTERGRRSAGSTSSRRSRSGWPNSRSGSRRSERRGRPKLPSSTPPARRCNQARRVPARP
jgi:hypothetical protein